MSRYLDFTPEQFEFNLLTRSGRITYANLELRDPAVVNRIGRVVERTPERIVTRPPALSPLKLGDLELANRVVLAPFLPETSDDSRPGLDVRDALVGAARAGAGLVMVGPVAISEHGRITSRSLGCWSAQHARSWNFLINLVYDEGTVTALRLTHSGRRGSTRPRDGGADRPLSIDGWTTLAPSAIPYAPWVPPPAAVDAQRFNEVREDFVEAARHAKNAGASALVVDCSDGYLLASFLSPLSNQRTDEYGGSLENRLRYPLQVIAAVREVWPDHLPLGVRLLADDRHRDGVQPDEAVVMARAMTGAGAQFIDVTAGLTVGSDLGAGDYRRLYQVPLADRIRNEADVPTIASGRITTIDEINTIVAAGRADLCVLDPRMYR